MVEQGIARPILIGRQALIERRITELGLSMHSGRDYELLDPNENPHYKRYCDYFFQRVRRQGFSPKEACKYVRNIPTVVASVMLALGEAGAMLCGTVGRYGAHLMPNQDAANIAFNMLKVLGDGIAIGPILLGTAKSAHVVTPSISVRGLLNMAALAVVRAGSHEHSESLNDNEKTA